MASDEYRFLTFLFYDLVDSTPMSQSLDEEAWWNTLREFQRLCSDTIRRHGGEIHDNHGDGSLAYFGYPAKQRVSAVQAVRAALELVDESDSPFSSLNRQLAAADLSPIRLRIGLHSGRVVIGTVDGRRKATGVVLACAERLQRCAAPNSVILSSATLDLLGDRVRVECKGEHTLKGIDQPVVCYRAIAENAEWYACRTRFVGRRNELDWLSNQWQQSVPGHVNTVLVSGEAGIGKTRLISEFRNAIQNQNNLRHTWRCLPEMSDKAWHPIVSALHKRLSRPDLSGIADVDTRLKAIIPAELPRQSALPAMKYMLGLTRDAGEYLSFSSSEARRQESFNLMVDALVFQSQEQALLLIVEDVQWIDPSTLECLHKLSLRTDCGCLMLLLTQRSDESENRPLPMVSNTLQLRRLSGRDALSLATGLPGGQALGDAEINRVLERSDGVPLFIEESANLEIDGRPTPEMDVLPPRLVDLLSERLDRVGDARETAGLAAAIGREFSLALLEHVSTAPASTIRTHVQSLVDAGLILCREGVGRFKHALVRDSAYAVMLASRRRLYHGRIALALEGHGLYDEPVSPDRLAVHHQNAGNHDRAFELWMQAGVVARRRSEQFEAISHFNRAEQLIDRLDGMDAEGRDRIALQLHLDSVRCHVALEGYGSDEGYRHARCAEALALNAGLEQQLINARFAACSWLFVRGRISEALQIAVDCHQRSESALQSVTQDAECTIRNPLVLTAARASWSRGNLEFHAGEMEQSIPRIQHCIELCRTVAPMRRNMDQDPLVMCLCYRAWHEWESCDPERSIATVGEAVDLAYENGRAFSIALSLAFRSAIHLFRGESEAAVDYATQSIGISQASRYATWYSWALVLRGRALAENPALRHSGIEDIVEGLSLWDASNAKITRAYMLAQLAEARSLHGEHVPALNAIEEALVTADRHGDRYYEAAIYRIKGQILGRAPESRRSLPDIVSCYQRSISLAEQRNQLGSALSACVALCQLDPDGEHANTRLLRLQQALSHVKSGFTTRDPAMAKALVDSCLGVRATEYA